MTRFDLASRKHESCIDSLQAAHDTVQAELSRAEPACAVEAEESTDAEDAELGDILGEAVSEINAAKQATAQESQEVRMGMEASESRKEEKPLTAKAERRHDPEEVEACARLSPAMREIVSRYPRVFETLGRSSEAADMDVPPGWILCLENALAVIARSGITVSVKAFSMHHGALRVKSSRYESLIGQGILNSLLAITREVCPLCGKHMAETEICRNIEGGPGFCKACLGSGTLAASRPLEGGGHDWVGI